jgi:putative transposase
MIRTHIIDCNLKRAEADALNRASGQRYTQVMLFHWRTYRHKGHWLSANAAQRWNDHLNAEQSSLLQAHSIDAAQQAFYKACKTAKANRAIGAKYPHKRKRWRTTIWKQSAIRRQADRLLLSRAKGLPPITVELPEHLHSVLRVLEVRLVYDQRAHRYTWHLVVENGKQPKAAPGTTIVAVDLGEIHPAVIGDERQATIITCRERRHQQQGHAKRLAKLSKALSRKLKGSRRERRLKAARSRMRAKHKRVMRDMEHKISRAIVDVAVEHQAGRIVIGDVRDIADGVEHAKRHNQQVSQWNHGRLRQYISYKAAAEGMLVELIEEHYTSQTCPTCGGRHKPRGRNYSCGRCGFSAHRDVVGQINILSRYKTGEVGNLRAPSEIKHRIPHNVRVMRRRQGTGQPATAVARGTGRSGEKPRGFRSPRSVTWSYYSTVAYDVALPTNVLSCLGFHENLCSPGHI